jgi:hypothetical protein
MNEFTAIVFARRSSCLEDVCDLQFLKVRPPEGGRGAGSSCLDQVRLADGDVEIGVERMPLPKVRACKHSSARSESATV